ncbi:MAG: hypothetical protein D6722_24100, partial [Bacteroidetes bacterium]
MIALGLLMPGWLASQPAETMFRRLSLAEGLSGSVVTALCQDHRGFVWIGTQRGLNRYDAYTFSPYLLSETDSSRQEAAFIRAIYEDPQHRLWVGTESGRLYRYHREADRLERVAGPQVGGVRAITMDAQGQLWMGTQAGAYPIDSAAGGWRIGAQVAG